MSNTDKMRIPPVNREQWTDEICKILNSFGGPFSDFNLQENDPDSVSPVLSSVLQHPKLAESFFPFAGYLLQHTSLDPRSLKLLVLRVSWLRRSEFEWSQHSMVSLKNGLLTEDDIQRIKSGSDAEGWNEKESALLQAVDQLLQQSNINENTWKTLEQHLDRQQLIDLVFVIGGYVLVGMYINSFGVPLTENMKGFD